MTRWSGPPPLLIAATVLGLVLAPAVSSADDGSGAASRGTTSASARSSGSSGATLSASEPRDRDPATGGAASSSTADGSTSDRGVASPPSPSLLGIATFNQHRPLTIGQARADAERITSRKGVGIIGWQEGYEFGPVYSWLARKGWSTKRFGELRGASELAVSWRRARFKLVGAKLHRATRGVDSTVGRYPFGDRFILRVTLRERSTGRDISIINTHLPQAIEDLDSPGAWRDTLNAGAARQQLRGLAKVWRNAPGRWVVGTGDYNFDARSDARRRPEGGIARVYDGLAVSSYALSTEGDDVAPTHPFSDRYIDYVHLRRADVDAGRVRVLGQRTMGGVHSDHRPLLVWLKLR
ncbi:hypothetical protein [Nocardioides sp. R-C-SC26]|uniref:hypothetical protein n=1 Tax=Nocardioides sp. R-C-SC26 TaxID=2870414 RepID=UPI001E644C27|nr:hypothetical protein [Nocardioides sp. R-C-SC26]